jgi:hypothetical protein
MFTKEFVRIVVGKKVWKNNAFCLNLSEYCAASSKAFCLLVVENNYARWSDMVGSGDHGDKRNSASAPLYTNAGKSNQKMGLQSPFRVGQRRDIKDLMKMIVTMRRRRRKRRRRRTTRIWMRETVMILIPINTTTANCRTGLKGTQPNFVWKLT